MSKQGDIDFYNSARGEKLLLQLASHEYTMPVFGLSVEQLEKKRTENINTILFYLDCGEMH